MKIYRVWYQKTEENKDYQIIFGNIDTAKSYAEGISGNENINFVSVREFGCDDEEGVFEEGNIVYEYGDFNPLTEGWGYVM